MITAKEACKGTHRVREDLMKEIKDKIEKELYQCLSAGSFSTIVYFSVSLGEDQQEELSDYMKELGYDVEYCKFDSIKFSWLVD